MTRAAAIEVLQARAREVRARATVRAWEYRQRHHSKGAWLRFRRLLAGAASAWSIPESDAHRLIAEGYEPAAVGALLEPSKTMIFVCERRLSEIPGRRRLELRLGAELLGSRWLALVPFKAPALGEREGIRSP